MKIVCDSCGAKYSIADEKVAGKIFKIRCKKCSSVLEVRGDQTGAHALDDNGPGQEPALDGGWYIVVDGEQRGPLPPIELSQLFAKGSVGLDSYVWKEGFNDWKVAGEVPELVQILGGVGSTLRGETAKIATDSSTGVGGDLFSDSNGREPTGEIDTHDNAFTGLDERPAAMDDPAAAPVAASTEDGSGPFGGLGGLGGGGMGAQPARMTGQRNENSVLFSLGNLQQLASRGGSPAEASPEPPRAQGGPSPQASGEGSGLIDIRALAKSTTPGTRTAPSQAVDDLLSIGASAGGGTLGAPLLGPAPMQSSDGNRWLWIAGAAVAMIAIVGAGVGVGMALGGSEDDGLEVAGQAPVEAVPNPNANSNAGAAVVAEQEPAPEPEEAAAFEEPAEEPIEAPEFEEPAAKNTTTASSKQRTNTTRKRRTRSAAAGSAPADPAPTKRRSGNNLDALMDEVVGGSSPTPKKAATSSNSTSRGSGEQAAPSRSDVKTALQGVSGGVKACNQGNGGTATVDVAFSGSTGRVSKARVVSGPFKGTPVGACIEKAVKRARVPRFKQSTFNVKFPYRL